MKSESRGPSHRRFQAAIRSHGVFRHVGFFPTKEERDEATRSARRELEETGTVTSATERYLGEDELDQLLWLHPSRRWTPEESLYLAVLERALADLHSLSAKRRREAREWIESDAVHQFSFATCCDVIEREVVETRGRLLGRDAWHRNPSGLRLVRKGTVKLS